MTSEDTLIRILLLLFVQIPLDASKKKHMWTSHHSTVAPGTSVCRTTCNSAAGLSQNSDVSAEGTTDSHRVQTGDPAYREGIAPSSLTLKPSLHQTLHLLTQVCTPLSE